MALITPLLEGTDGVQKMSKSLGNYIGIDEPAREIYGKTMSIPDSLMKDYFVDPQVIVTVKDYRTEYVRVIGHVNRPGPIQLTGEQKLDVVDVIAMAGGPTPRAKNSVEYTHNGVTRTLKLDELKKETDPAKKVWVQPGDIIDVKEGIL